MTSELLEQAMDNLSHSFAPAGVVPPVFDENASERHLRCRKADEIISTDKSYFSRSAPRGKHSHVRADPSAEHESSMRRVKTAIAELCSAIRSALDDERSTAEDSLRRAAEILREMGEARTPEKEQARGGLAPWQVSRVASYVDAHLDSTIRNEDLATIARLNPSHFGRSFRNSFGEPPHEYVIRRRIERAQGLMLSTNAPLSAIALDCGLADQAHLSRLFRRIVGDTPRAWRRARVGEPTTSV
jgi:AraC family transcriptional regulator